MALPTPPPSQPPLDGRFFPSGDDAHQGLNRELAKSEELVHGIVQPADYQRALAAGYEAAFGYLLDVPLEVSSLDPFRIKDLHRILFGSLYRHAGLLRPASVPGDFGGRFGADSADIPIRLANLHANAVRHTGTLAGIAPADEEKMDGREKSERLAFIANYHATLIWIHPFRDGNGRLARLISWWQELCLTVHPICAVPRAAYMAGMKALPRNLRLLHNFFLERHGLPIVSCEPLAPTFPVWVAPTQG